MEKNKGDSTPPCGTPALIYLDIRQALLVADKLIAFFVCIHKDKRKIIP